MDEPKPTGARTHQPLDSPTSWAIELARDLAARFQHIGVRVLFAGGLAAIAHGHLRARASLDLVLPLDGDELPLALSALGALGYTDEALARQDAPPAPRARNALQRFALGSVMSPGVQIGLFALEEAQFHAARAKALRWPAAPGLDAWLVDLQDLINLLRAAPSAAGFEELGYLETLLRVRRGARAAAQPSPAPALADSAGTDRDLAPGGAGRALLSVGLALDVPARLQHAVDLERLGRELRARVTA